MTMNKKAQVGIEALVGIAVVFFIFLGMFILYETKRSDVFRAEQELKEREECLSIATLVTTIFILGDDTQITTKLNYPMTIQPSAQKIEMEHSFCTIRVAGISNNASSNNFLLSPGLVQISNENGDLQIENV